MFYCSYCSSFKNAHKPEVVAHEQKHHGHLVAAMRSYVLDGRGLDPTPINDQALQEVIDAQKMSKYPKKPTLEGFLQITPRSGIVNFHCHYCEAVLNTREGFRAHHNQVHPRLYYCQFCDNSHSKLPSCDYS